MAFRRVREAFEVLLGRAATRPADPAPTVQPIVVPVSGGMLRVGANVPVPIVRWAHCAGCDGVGTVAGKRGKCEHCHGAGQALRGTPSFMLPCGPCRGAGKAATVCTVCHGSGRKLVALQTTIRIPAGTADGAEFRVQTIDGPAYVKLKAVAPRR